MNVPPGSRKVRKTFMLYDDGYIPVAGATYLTLPDIFWTGDQGVQHQIVLRDFTNPAWTEGQVLEVGGGEYRLDLPDEMWPITQSIHVRGDDTDMHVVMPDIDVQYVQAAAVVVSDTLRVVLGSTGDSFTVGEQVIQNVTDASATVVAADEGHLIIDGLSGTSDDVHTWEGQTSFGVFTPSGDGTPAVYPELLQNSAEIADAVIEGIGDFGGGASAQQVWEYARRTLTAGAAQVGPGQQRGRRTIVRGDSYGTMSRTFRIDMEAGADWPTDLSSWAWTFTANKDASNTNSGSSSITGTVSIINATGADRALRVSITHTNTQAAALGRYNYDVQGTAGSERWSPELGVLTVLEDATTS